jgi:LysM repeat protein
MQSATLTPSPSNLAPGSTIQHHVAVGEWLIQIGRCYGARFEDVRNANPQIADPDFILPAMIVTIPRIGSAGRIYGPPCITFHTVQSGDTWASIAQRYNADVAVLQHVNQALSLTPGTVIKIPLNSAGAGGVTPVTATATATATATTTVTAQRITFPAGQTTASVAGVVSPTQTAQYVVATAQGQVLTVSVTTSAANEVGMGVNGPTGLPVKSLDGTLTWSANIATGGDYYINVASIAGSSSKAFTLTVSLTSPVTATPTFTATATATSTPTTPNPYSGVSVLK